MEGFAGSLVPSWWDDGGAVASGPCLTAACTIHVFEGPKKSGEQGGGDGGKPPGSPSLGQAACLDPSTRADVSSQQEEPGVGVSWWLEGRAPLGSQVHTVRGLGRTLLSRGDRARHSGLCPLVRMADSFVCRSKF